MGDLNITPGPWEWDDDCLMSGMDEVLSSVWFPGPERFIGSHDPADVCLPDPRNEANCKAIAAVPEMLDALIACRDNYGKRGGLINDPNAPGALIDKIRAALEKAGVTGESND